MDIVPQLPKHLRMKCPRCGRWSFNGAWTMETERNEKIKELRKLGNTYHDIAKLYGITKQRVAQIVNEKYYL